MNYNIIIIRKSVDLFRSTNHLNILKELNKRQYKII